MKPQERFALAGCFAALGSVWLFVAGWTVALWTSEGTMLPALLWLVFNAGFAAVVTVHRLGVPESLRRLEKATAYVPRPAFFRTMATISLLFSMVLDPNFWTDATLFFIALGTLRWLVSHSFPLPEDVPEPGKASIGLNLLAFICPPVGLATWLCFDHKNRRLARCAGRSAIRGATLMLLAGNYLLIAFLVQLAIHNIHLAELNPMDDSKVRIMERQRALRRELAGKTARTPNGDRPTPVPPLNKSQHKSEHLMPRTN